MYRIIIIITVLSIIFGGITLFWVGYHSIEQQQISFNKQQRQLRNEMKMQRSEDTFHTTPMIGYSEGS